MNAVRAISPGVIPRTMPSRHLLRLALATARLHGRVLLLRAELMALRRREIERRRRPPRHLGFLHAVARHLDEALLAAQERRARLRLRARIAPVGLQRPELHVVGD